MKKWLEIKKSSFMEGTFMATLAIVIVKILGIIYIIPFYRIVGIEGGALYSYAYNIYVMFLDISTIGLPIAISKITNEYNTLKMIDAKQRSYQIAIKLMRYISIIVFIILFLFAKPIASLIIGNLQGGNTIKNVTIAIRFVSLAILIIPYLSVTKGYLQGHNIINIPSISNIIEQVIRIIVVLLGSFITIKIFHKDYSLGVYIALLGAFLGGLVAYIYIKTKVNNINTKILKQDLISNKDIFKKIISYAIPYIIINAMASLYSFIDMLLVLRTTSYLGYSTLNVEFISSAISTWSIKINMIVTSIAMGMTISLIPTIVNAYTLKNMVSLNKKINTSLKLVLYISLPLAIGISLLSKEVWNIFYGYSIIGSNILSLSVFMAVTLNIYMITSSIAQGLNQFKIVYKASLLGFLVNSILDIPLMLLFNKIGIPSYLGATVSSIIGYLLSSIVTLISIYQKLKITYKDTLMTLIKMLLPISLLITVVLLLRLVPFNQLSKGMDVIFIIINALLGGFVYLYSSIKIGLLNDIINVEKLKKKIPFLNHIHG